LLDSPNPRKTQLEDLNLGVAVASNGAVEATYAKEASVYHEQVKRLGGHTFIAPPQPSLGQALQSRVLTRTARVVLIFQGAADIKMPASSITPCRAVGRESAWSPTSSKTSMTWRASRM
jgi:hypothetical protein